jgi:LysM repeat protein
MPEMRALVAFLVIVPLLAGAQGTITPKNAGHTLKGSSYNIQNIALLNTRDTLHPRAQGGADMVEIIDTSALKSNQSPAENGIEQIAQRQSGNVSLYVVQDGDTLGHIAEMFGISKNTIIWANDLKNSVVRPGQSLLILPISGVRHQIREGDTLESLAQKYNGDVERIRDFNDISDDSALVVGQFINIPDGEPEKSPAPRIAPRTASSPSGWLVRPIFGGFRSQGIHGFNAVDLAAPIGTPIVAAASGTVVTARADGAWNGGYGNFVMIRHENGVKTLYSHFGAVLVGVGERVVQGQTLGFIGMTGRTTGPHVHFEVRGAKNPF